MDGYCWLSNANSSRNVMSYRGYISFNWLRLSAAEVSHPPVSISRMNSDELDAIFGKGNPKDEKSCLGVQRHSTPRSFRFAISYLFPTVFMAALTGLPGTDDASTSASALASSLSRFWPYCSGLSPG
jgi:hypothetical protein